MDGTTIGNTSHVLRRAPNLKTSHAWFKEHVGNQDKDQGLFWALRVQSEELTLCRFNVIFAK